MGYLSRVTTKGGYKADECLSALQKALRRGEEREALAFARQLEMIPKTGPSIVWNRLQIVSVEDIGPADPDVIVQVHTLRALYDRFKPGGGAAMALATAIILLSRSPKSRIADSLVAVVYEGDFRPEIPDHALDKHTSRGARLGRGMQHFLDEGAVLANPSADVPDCYEEEAWPYFLARGQKREEEPQEEAEPGIGQARLEI